MADVVGGTIVWNLDVNKQKFSVGIDSARDAIAKLASDGKSKITSLSSSISNSFKKAEDSSKLFASGLLKLGAGILTVGAGFGGIVGIGLKTAAEFETLTTALTTVTGSSEKAVDAMKTIKQVAKDSPFFEVSTLAQFTQLMAASGQSIEEAVKSGIKFGDVAAAFGKGNAEMTRMGNTLSQVIGKGKADIVDFKELVNAGWVSVRRDVAESMGITMAQFEEMVSAGKIGYAEIAKAAEKFAGAAENQSTNFASLLSRLKETITTTFAELVINTGIFDAAKVAIKQLITVLDNIDIDKVAEFLKKFVENIPVITGFIIGGLVPAIYAWTTAMFAALIPLIPFLAIGTAVGIMVKLVIKHFDSIKDAFENVKTTFTNVFDTIKTKFTDFKNKIVETFTAIKDKIKENADTIRDVFLVLSGPVGWGVLISENYDLIKQKSTELKDGLIEILGGLVTQITTFFNELPNNIAYGLGYAWGTILNWGQSIVNFFTTTIPMWIENIGFFFVGLGDTITVALQNIFLNIVIWGLQTITYFQENIPLWIESIVMWFSELPGRIWAVLVSLYTQFVNWGTTTWNYLVTTVTMWITNLVAWFRALPGKISEALSTLGQMIKQRFLDAWEAVKAEISSWPGRLIEWGKKIAQSFVEGIKDGLKALAGAFRDGLNAARGNVEGHSPPKEGPYKNIDDWGFNVGTAWVDGMTMALSQVGSKLQSSIGLNALNINGIPSQDISSGGLQEQNISTTNSNQITVNIGQVNDVEDLDMLNREIGFRLGVTPV